VAGLKKHPHKKEKTKTKKIIYKRIKNGKLKKKQFTKE